MSRIKVAVLGSGNIGTDLMLKLRRSEVLELTTMIGIDPDSDGLKRASDLGYVTISTGIKGFLERPALLLDIVATISAYSTEQIRSMACTIGIVA